MRGVATRERIERFLEALGRRATRPVTVYLVGGSSAVLEGWRDATIDIDLKLVPDAIELLRAIRDLKDELSINVELASPDLFIPVPPGWESRSPAYRRVGKLDVRHFDFCAQALAKIERGHVRDLADVDAMIERGLVTRRAIAAAFALVEPELVRFPGVDAADFAARIADVVGREA